METVLQHHGLELKSLDKTFDEKEITNEAVNQSFGPSKHCWVVGLGSNFVGVVGWGRLHPQLFEVEEDVGDGGVSVTEMQGKLL